MNAIQPVATTPNAAGSALSGELSGPDPAGPGAGELVRRWLLGKRSEQTRRAYGRDLGLWLAWCSQLGADPLQVQRVGRETGATLISPAAGTWSPRCPCWPSSPAPAAGSGGRWSLPQAAGGWTRHAAADWATYAADVATNPNHQP